MPRITNPIPLYLDRRGALLDAGKLYFGQPNADPESNPIQVYWDKERTIPAVQPIRTLGGVVVNGTDPSFIFAAEDDFSMRIKDANDVLVIYIASTEIDTPDFQPLDSDLTAIAALSTSAYGRNILTLANQAALRSAIGYPEPLPAAGGTVGGNIIRGGAGPVVFHNEPTFTSGRIFVINAGDPDPTGSPGDMLFVRQ